MVFCAVIEQIIVGDSDRTAFFETFNLGVIAKTSIFGGKGAFWASSKSAVTQGAGGNDGDSGEATRKFMLKEAIFGPGIEAVEDNGFLAGRDEILGFGDGLAANPIFAFGSTNHFAEFFFATAIRGTLDAAFGHFGIDHVAKVNFWNAHRGEIVNNYGFTTTGHTDDGENVKI